MKQANKTAVPQTFDTYISIKSQKHFWQEKYIFKLPGENNSSFAIIILSLLGTLKERENLLIMN